MTIHRIVSILYVDTDSEACRGIEDSLRSDGLDFRLVCVTGTEAAFDQIRRQTFDIYIFEYCLFEMTGAQLCRTVRLTDRETPMIIYTSLDREIDRETAMTAGANAFVVKSDRFANLSSTISRLLKPRPLISRHYHTARRSSNII